MKDQLWGSFEVRTVPIVRLHQMLRDRARGVMRNPARRFHRRASIRTLRALVLDARLRPHARPWQPPVPPSPDLHRP